MKINKFILWNKGHQSVNTHSTHISEMMIGNPNTMVKDRSPMWKDFKDNRFERPFMVINFLEKKNIKSSFYKAIYRNRKYTL